MSIKSILSTAFFLFFCHFNAQVVEFDYLAKYQWSCCEKKESMEERVVYLSQDPNYFLTIYNGANKQLTGALLDLSTKSLHYFDIHSENKDGELLFVLNYNHSKKINDTKEKNLGFRFAKTDMGNDLQIFKSRSKKNLRTYNLRTEPSDRNYFKAFQAIGVHPYEAWQELQPNENFKVKEATLTFSDGTTMQYAMVQEKNAQMTVTIPKKLNYMGAIR